MLPSPDLPKKYQFPLPAPIPPLACLSRSQGCPRLFGETAFSPPITKGKLVNKVMVTLLARLTGFWLSWITGLNYLVCLSPTSPFLGLVLLGSGKAMQRLRQRGHKGLAGKIDAAR